MTWKTCELTRKHGSDGIALSQPEAYLSRFEANQEASMLSVRVSSSSMLSAFKEVKMRERKCCEGQCSIWAALSR